MPTSFSFSVDTVEVPKAQPLRRAHTVPIDEGLYATEPAGEPSSSSREDAYAGLCSPNGQPYEYPAPIFVRNTFVSVHPPGRDPSLEGFFEERRIHSCPANWGPGEDDEAPLASCRTTACDSASDGGAAASMTPLDLSDTEDMSELTPRVAGGGRAAALPHSSTTFRKTVSEYRRSEDGQPAPRWHAAQPPFAHFDPNSADMLQRQALPPGPIQAAVQMQTSTNGERVCYYLDHYGAPLIGYEAGYDVPYDNNRYDGVYIHSYDAGYSAGYQPGMSGYALVPEFGTGPGHESMSLHSDPRLAPSQEVLQLSSPIHPGMQPPPPPGAPAPSPAPLPPPPAPPAEEPMDQLAPTRGSLGHGAGRCKPCAFVHTKGCDNGFECPFCHLCEPGEKKRRRKDKLEARRAVREFRQAFPFSNSIPIGPGYVS